MMSRPAWQMPTKNEMLILALGVSAPVLSILLRILDVPIISETWRALRQCGIDACRNIEISVSIVTAVVTVIGTFFIVLTLIITIRSSNKRDIQNQKQIDRMTGQIEILTQNNRMKYLKEYMTALSIKIYSHVDGYYHGRGLRIVKGENGVIFRWKIFRKERLLDYRFCVTFKTLSSEEKDIDEILKDESWWNVSIEIIRINKTSYVMTGYAKGIDLDYLPIEKAFQNMNEEQYNNVMMVILATTTSDISSLMDYQRDLEKS